MITKAIIEQIDLKSNKYSVRIPLFEKPGIESKDSKLSSSLFKATLSHEPTIVESYKVGDVVFVGFESDELDKPIILGKLFRREDVKINIGKLESNTLKIHDKVELPKNTTIGDVNFANIFNYFKFIDEHLDHLNSAHTTNPDQVKVGDMMFDSTLKKPIWWDGENWVDAMGSPV